MTVLINAGTHDTHAKAVVWGLRRKGTTVFHLASDRFCQTTAFSIRVGAAQSGATLAIDGETVALDQLSAVWHRRPFEALQNAGVQPEDEVFARGESQLMREGLYRSLELVPAVNPLDALVRAENKIHQLKHAAELGFQLPATLISGSPEDVRGFLAQHAECIYKPLRGHVWKSDSARRATYTAKVSEADLPADSLLRAAPGIYQARVEYAFEVRAQFFGRQCAAIRIEQPTDGSLDWRRSQGTIDTCEVVDVPLDKQQRCHRLMEALGLVAAGFDFLVTDDGRWIFLEINQAGQFLFVEQWCPGLPMLDMFCEFIRAPSLQWRYDMGHAHRRISYSEFIESTSVITS